tara:strand:- start:642 stop:1718 length:1077 start_codon:yes stop_codon:yes gene_type:complete
MRLSELSIHRVRALSQVDIKPAAGLNTIVGPNGSGKSSCLESIYMLGLGRSFRSRSVRELITFGENDLLVRGQVVDSQEQSYALGIERSRQHTRIRVNGEDVKAASELARHLPLLLITPESQRLLTDGTRLRRRMLDWALFHVEPQYFPVYQRYKQALRQRNAGLRQAMSLASMSPWDAELEHAAETLHSLRERYVDEVKTVLKRILQSLMGHPLDLVYHPGWKADQPLGEAMSTRYETDCHRGYTSVGPHRADLKFLVDGIAAQNVLSRGESKLFVAAVLLAQTAHVIEQHAAVPVVLIDDMASELDEENRAKLLRVIREVGAQTFLTAVTGDALPEADWDAQKMFHVERGLLHEMV